MRTQLARLSCEIAFFGSELIHHADRWRGQPSRVFSDVKWQIDVVIGHPGQVWLVP